MSATGWTAKDIVGVRDISGDKVPDLLFRDNADLNRTLALRKGKPGPSGGADLNSLPSASAAPPRHPWARPQLQNCGLDHGRQRPWPQSRTKALAGSRHA
ncbi:hypothetical protein AQF52_7848 [Streptomyces venezuelae]|nr:hypothetical protein AQF52_7848 [Streptomyces venezuelae]CUM35848.1 hypothetical protein BN2537_661 [Streptomyces venezuelae]